MSGLQGQIAGNRIRLRRETAGNGSDVVILDTRKDLFAAANAIAGSCTSTIEDPYWRLEIAKLVASDGFTIIGQAEKIVATLKAQPNVRFTNIADAERVRFAVYQLFNRDGRDTREWSRLRVFAVFRYVLSCIIAILLWVWTVLRNGRGNRLPGSDKGAVLIAVHGEVSNRTRHVLSAAVTKSCQGIILLGRPKSGSKSLAGAAASEFDLPSVRIVRPIDPISAFNSLGCLMGHFRSGIGVSAATGFRMTWRDEIAALYRICLGAGSAEWWRREKPGSRIIIFGHTGLADTSMLEVAMQATGSKTVHWAHGLSGGWNYAGLSDLGLFKCGRDAEVHADLPGYRSVEYFPLPMPAYRHGNGKQWLLLTNYAHLTNPFFGHGAFAMEAGIIRMAAEAAHRIGKSIDDLVWRPHPVFWQLPEDARDAIFSDVSAAGCTLPVRDSSMPDPAEFPVILCTPSTVALDVLVTGQLPIIVSAHELPPETAYSAFPLVASDAVQIERAVQRLDARAEAAKIFTTAWERVRPGHQAVSVEMLSNRLQA